MSTLAGRLSCIYSSLMPQCIKRAAVQRFHTCLGCAVANPSRLQQADITCVIVQVVTRESGFGRVGAFLSPKFHQIYSIGGEPRSCGLWDYDRVEQLASQWAGIR